MRSTSTMRVGLVVAIGILLLNTLTPAQAANDNSRSRANGSHATDNTAGRNERRVSSPVRPGGSPAARPSAPPNPGPKPVVTRPAASTMPNPGPAVRPAGGNTVVRPNPGVKPAVPNPARPVATNTSRPAGGTRPNSLASAGSRAGARTNPPAKPNGATSTSLAGGVKPNPAGGTRPNSLASAGSHAGARTNPPAKPNGATNTSLAGGVKPNPAGGTRPNSLASAGSDSGVRADPAVKPFGPRGKDPLQTLIDRVAGHGGANVGRGGRVSINNTNVNRTNINNTTINNITNTTINNTSINNTAIGGYGLPPVVQIIENTIAIAQPIRLPPAVVVTGPSIFIPVDPPVGEGPIDVVSTSGVILSTAPVPGPRVIVDTFDAGARGPLTVEDPGTPALAAQTTRYLRIANAYSENVTIYVQYYTQTADGSWTWFPGVSADRAAEPMAITLSPGQSMDLQDGDWRVHARVVRVWGKSESGIKEWNMYKDTDLNLVSSSADLVDAGGQPYYMAADKDTVNFTVK